MSGKGWWQSKSVWASLFSAGAATLALIAATEGLGLSAQAIALLMLGSNLLNLWLRMVTSRPIRPIRPIGPSRSSRGASQAAQPDSS